MSQRNLSRRRLLGLGAVLPVVVACTPSTPTVNGSRSTPTPRPSSSSPTATPTPRPIVSRATKAATTELALAGLATAVLGGPGRTGLTADQRGRLRFLADAHRTHAAALDPTARAPRPPGVSGLSPDQALDRLAKDERRAVRAHRAAALSSSGDDALRFGSLAAAAAVYAAALAVTGAVPTGAGPRTPPRLARGTDVEAAQALVAQLHAVVYGYQFATGRLPVAGDRDDQAVAELLQLRIERDRLIGWLRRRGAEVPVPEPAYRPTVEVRDGPTGVRLIRTMLVALQPHAGVWLAAAGDAERDGALDFFVETATRGRGWGAPLTVWPG